MSYKGRYQPSYRESTKETRQTSFIDHFGNESSWFTVILNENILEWGSEEIAIPYRSPIDNREFIDIFPIFMLN